MRWKRSCALILRLAGVSLRHSSLDIDRALNRIDDAAELGQKAIAHELEDATAMLRYRRFHDFIAVSLDPLKGFRREQPWVPADGAPSSRCLCERLRLCTSLALIPLKSNSPLEPEFHLLQLNAVTRDRPIVHG